MSIIAEETRLIYLEDVVDKIIDKLIKRHPTLFGDIRVSKPRRGTV